MCTTTATRIFASCTTYFPSGISLKQSVERYRNIFRQKPGTALFGRSPLNRHQCSANLFQQGSCLGTSCVKSRSARPSKRRLQLPLPCRLVTPKQTHQCAKLPNITPLIQSDDEAGECDHSHEHQYEIEEFTCEYDANHGL